MKIRNGKEKRIIKRTILTLGMALLICLFAYHLVSFLKGFEGGNIAKSAEREKEQIKNSVSIDKYDKEGKLKQSETNNTEVGKLNKTKESGHESNLQKQEEKINQSNIEQQAIQNQKTVFLTFDDGPSELTSQILDELKKEKIQATFFMVGKNIYDHQETVKRAVHEGNYIGAHSMTHNYNRLYKQGHFVSEMEQTLSIIYNLTGEKNRLVRAPYGSKPGMNVKLRNDSANAGLKILDWSVDTYDWKSSSNASTVINEVKRQTNKINEVILLHEKQETLEALPEIISFLRAKGYVFKVYNPNEHFSLNFWNDPRL